ncbi:MAG: SDR family oxidoreductase [Deltaproteobacteria bacterium]|nr:SDR family oxidoreductase [Deltaproteobacteria bacterium]
MEKRLQGKAIIVSGAGTAGEGIGNGKAAALKFGREGAQVLCVDQNGDAAAGTAERIREEGGIAQVCQADVTSAADCDLVVDSCLKSFQKIDVLHNNVGIPGYFEIVDLPEDSWSKVFDVNVKGMFMMCKRVIPPMIKNGGGSIINISSIASHRPLPDAVYCSSKGAVDALTLYIARRYGRHNIRANVLLLGYIDTPLARPAWEIEKIKEINLKQVPLRRFASPMEVANVAAFLASDEAAYINGVILPVDGGLLVSL